MMISALIQLYDDYKGAFVATELLTRSRVQTIAHISGPRHLKNFYDRCKVNRELCKANKIEVIFSICSGNISIESWREGQQHLLS
jgi:DNA-binding LacI/PurR family transcriptional regulator